MNFVLALLVNVLLTLVLYFDRYTVTDFEIDWVPQCKRSGVGTSKLKCRDLTKEDICHFRLVLVSLS